MIGGNIGGSVPGEAAMTRVENSETLSNSPSFAIASGYDSVAMITSQAAPDGVTTVDRLARSKELRPDARPNAIRADKSIMFLHAPVAEMKMHFAAILFESIELLTEADGCGRKRIQQNCEEIGAPNTDGRNFELSERNVHHGFAAARPDEKIGVCAAASQNIFEQAQFAQDARGVGPQHHAGADLMKARRSFVHNRMHACPTERHGRGDSTDPSSNNSNARCDHNQEAGTKGEWGCGSVECLDFKDARQLLIILFDI